MITNLKLHFIGIGGAGSNMVESICKKGIQAKYTIITNPKRPHLASNINYIEYIPNEETLFPHYNQKIDVPIGIRNIFNHKETYVLLAGFGGYTGTLVTAALIDLLLQNRNLFFAFSSLPFDFEGKKRKQFANDMRQKFQNLTNFYSLDLQLLKDKYSDDLSLYKFFDKVDEEFYTMIENIISN